MFYGVLLYHFNDICFDLSAKNHHQAKLEYQINVTINYVNPFSCRNIYLRSQLHIFRSDMKAEIIKHYREETGSTKINKKMCLKSKS